jgi:hypothetical protein
MTLTGTERKASERMLLFSLERAPPHEWVSVSLSFFIFENSEWRSRSATINLHTSHRHSRNGKRELSAAYSMFTVHFSLSLSLSRHILMTFMIIGNFRNQLFVQLPHRPTKATHIDEVILNLLFSSRKKRKNQFLCDKPSSYSRD